MQLRQQILQDKGLELKRQPYRRTVGRLTDAPIIVDPRKTGLMLRLEAYHRKPIEQLIESNRGSMVDIGLYLDIAPSTVCKWRKKLGVNHSEAT